MKDREDDIAAHEENLKVINNNGAKISQKQSLSEEDQENIQRDLNNLNDRWKKVCCSLALIVCSLETINDNV